MAQTPQYVLRRIRQAKDDHLAELDLCNHRSAADESLTQLPDEVCELDWLETLNVAGHLLTGLPDSISRLRKLTTLHLSNNQLERLPDSIGELQNLRHLYLSQNRLTTLPESISQLTLLSWLNLRSNRLRALPDTVYRLKHLDWLDVGENPLEVPPPEVVRRGADAVKNYFRQISFQGTDYLYEAKLLVVGEGGAGKTTFANKILDSGYELRDEDSTKGIDIIPWSFTMEDGRPFRVNIWDFGGQEIYHATHQFFLTRRSLYALVADSRKEDTDFFYWLNVVDLLSDHSPLLIIHNEKQDRRRDINESQLRGQFSNLKETVVTNLATNRGLPGVVREVKHHICNLPHIGTRLPKTWVAVREELETDSRNHITLAEYLLTCERHGFTAGADKLQLSGYLHDLGVILHFQEDPLLKKTVVLKPRWGTDAVYKVLDSETVRRNHGKFSRDDLARIWSAPEYDGMQDELLQLMINFKLAYRIPGSEFYIAPQLLAAEPPHVEWGDSKALTLRYEYEFMPKGIMTQFIVTMHTFIADEEHVWRGGVILTREDTKAQVVEDYGRREIRVRVVGKHKREMLTIVVYELDRIHESYKRLQFTKLIPCNCAPCRATDGRHFYPFEVLRQFMADGVKLIQCRKSYKMVSVPGLLDEITDRFRERSESEEPTSRDHVFISYSHADERWCTDLLTMLKPAVRNKTVSVWTDTMMEAGSPWRQEIEDAISAAKVAVLLVSKHFLASDFIAEHELPPLLDAGAKEGLTILWVPVSDSMYTETPLSDYQAVSDPSKPLDSLAPPDLNRALVKICDKILKAASA